MNDAAMKMSAPSEWFIQAAGSEVHAAAKSSIQLATAMRAQVSQDNPRSRLMAVPCGWTAAERTPRSRTASTSIPD